MFQIKEHVMNIIRVSLEIIGFSANEYNAQYNVRQGNIACSVVYVQVCLG